MDVGQHHVRLDFDSHILCCHFLYDEAASSIQLIPVPPVHMAQGATAGFPGEMEAAVAARIQLCESVDCMASLGEAVVVVATGLGSAVVEAAEQERLRVRNDDQQQVGNHVGEDDFDFSVLL